MYCVPGIISVIEFNPHNNTLRWMVIIISFYRWRKWGLENNTITGRARIPTQGVWLQNLHSYPLSPSVRVQFGFSGRGQIGTKIQPDHMGKAETWVILFVFLMSASAFRGTDPWPYDLIGPIYLFTAGDSLNGLCFGPVRHGQEVIVLKTWPVLLFF